MRRGAALIVVALVVVAALWLRSRAPKETLWTAASKGLPTSGQWRSNFALADMDNDGDLDLVHGPARKGSPRPHVFLNDGELVFHEAKLTLPNMHLDYGGAAVLDVDGDGGHDIALAMHLTGMIVLRETAPFTYESFSDGLPSKSFSARVVRAVDWTMDGKPELAALSDTPSAALAIFERQGDAWKMLAGGSVFGDQLAIGDIDGDGRPDALLASHTMGARAVIVLNQGFVAQTIDGLPENVLIRGVALVNRVPAVALRFQREGMLISEVRVGEKKLELEDPRDDILSLAVGDVEPDGQPDLAAGTSDGSVLLFDALGPARRIKKPTGCHVYSLAFADLDGKKGDELVVSEAGEDACGYGGSIVVLRPAMRQ